MRASQPPKFSKSWELVEFVKYDSKKGTLFKGRKTLIKYWIKMGPEFVPRAVIYLLVEKNNTFLVSNIFHNFKEEYSKEKVRKVYPKIENVIREDDNIVKR